MAFPTDPTAAESGVTAARNWAKVTKQRCDALIITALAGPVTGRKIDELLTILQSTDTELDILSQIPGIGDQAKRQLDNQSLDIAVEFAAMRGAIQTAIAGIIATYPGGALHPDMQADGSKIYPSFDTADTGPLRAGLQAISDAIV